MDSKHDQQRRQGKVRKFSIIVVAAFHSFSTGAVAVDAIDCSTLPTWSATVSGYQVNLHHVFCGEKGKKTRAKGFHSTPGGKTPSTYQSSTMDSRPNAAGVYVLKNIQLTIGSVTYNKGFSSMFPISCSQAQVTQSIAYSHANNTGSCASPGWAQCGPSAPSGGDRSAYCVGDDGSSFTIASALLRKTNKINTGFPIYIAPKR
jgi:hypothetical protein